MEERKEQFRLSSDIHTHIYIYIYIYIYIMVRIRNHKQIQNANCLQFLIQKIQGNSVIQ